MAWQIGITASPSYVIPYNASISPVRFVKYFKLEPSFGTSASVLVSKNLNKHFQIEAGIGYSECRYKSVYALGTGRVNNPNDPIYQDFIAEKRVDSRLDYFQIPIRVNYLAGKGRVKFIGSIGVSPAWVVSRINTLSEIFTQAMYDYYLEPEKEKKADFNLFGEAGLGVIFQTSARVSFQLVARYSYGFIKFEQNELFRIYNPKTKEREENAVYNPGISALGLSLGCFFRFSQ